MFIGLAIVSGLNASEGVKAMESAQDLATPTGYAQFTTMLSNGLTRTKSGISSAATYLGETRIAGKLSDSATYLGTTRPVIFAASVGTSVATNVASAWNAEIRGYKHGGKVATSAAVLATVGLTYATYKAYKNGSFSKLNPFGKAVVAQAPVTEEAPVVAPVAAPVVMHQRTTRNNIRWN